MLSTSAVGILTDMVRDGFARLEARLGDLEARLGELEKTVARMSKDNHNGRVRQWLMWIFFMGLAFAGGSLGPLVIELVKNLK